MKTCCTCKIEKPHTCFGKSSQAKDGYRHRCRGCRAIEHVIWYEKNKEAVAERTRLDRIANPEKYRERYERDYKKRRLSIIEKTSEWGIKNREKKYSYCLKSRRERPDRYRASMMRYWTSKKNRTVPYSDPLAIEFWYFLAILKERITGNKYHVDHIIPLQGKTISGLHHENNLQLLTAEENIRKSNKFQPIY